MHSVWIGLADTIENEHGVPVLSARDHVLPAQEW
jgi:hypothetical protein